MPVPEEPNPFLVVEWVKEICCTTLFSVRLNEKNKEMRPRTSFAVLNATNAEMSLASLAN